MQVEPIKNIKIMKHYSKFVIDTVEELKKEILVNYRYGEIKQIVEGIAADEETAKVFLNTDFGENLVPDGVTPYLESMVTVQINDFDELLFKALRYKGDEKTTYYVYIKSSITNKDYRLVEIEVPSKRYAKRLKRNAQMIALCKYMLCNI